MVRPMEYTILGVDQLLSMCPKLVQTLPSNVCSPLSAVHQIWDANHQKPFGKATVLCWKWKSIKMYVSIHEHTYICIYMQPSIFKISDDPEGEMTVCNRFKSSSSTICLSHPWCLVDPRFVWWCCRICVWRVARHDNKGLQICGCPHLAAILYMNRLGFAEGRRDMAVHWCYIRYRWDEIGFVRWAVRYGGGGFWSVDVVGFAWRGGEIWLSVPSHLAEVTVWVERE